MSKISDAAQEALRLSEDSVEACTSFLRELIALPSPSGGERLACERVYREMEDLGYDEVRIDGMGNVLGRLGSGSRQIAFDAHVDTVGISRPASWPFDPFRGQVKDGVLHGRGASDQKGGVASIVHGAALAKRVGLPDDLELWVAATVHGEDCVGLAWRHLIEMEGLSPEAVVIAMPSHLGICRGQRGRLELSVSTEGVSSHGSDPDRGQNAISTMAPVVLAFSRLHRELEKEHPMLGRGSVAVTEIVSESPSLTAIPDGCRIHIDRRLTIGESVEEAESQIKALPEVRHSNASVEISEYVQRSWKGLEKSAQKYFPAWETREDSRVFQSGVTAARLILDREARIHRSAFSSNACAIAGRYGIPAIGFGPASESCSHSIRDQIPLAQLAPAMAFFALFPTLYLEPDMSNSAGI